MSILITYEHNEVGGKGLGKGVSWWQLVDVDLIRRSLIVSVVLGSVLTVVNQAGWFFGSDAIQKIPLVMVYLLPFLVISAAQVSGKRKAIGSTNKLGGLPSLESFIKTAMSQGIPSTGVKIGYVFGSLNLLVVFITTSDITTLPIVPIVQAYILPAIFSVISQAISYRRFCQLKPQLIK